MATLSPSRAAARPGEPRRTAARPRRVLWQALLFLLLPAAVLSVLYLALYVTRDFAFPIGYDTPKYLWRTNLVRALGLDGLPRSALPPFIVNADRPGLPILWAAGSSLLDVSSARFAMVFPPVMAVVMGFAGAALARFGLRQPAWTLPVFALAVGASMQISRMASPGHSENLMVTPLLLGGAALALLAADGRRAATGAVVLLTGAVLTHWIFAIVFAPMLLGVAVLSLPESLRRRREGARLLETPSGRLAGIVAAAGVLGGAGLASVAVGGAQPPNLRPASFLRKLAAEAPRYLFPIVAPLAALGVLFEARHADAGRRRTLALLLLWAASGPVALLALWAGVPLPAHRFLAFSLALPILYTAALLALAAFLGSRLGRAGKAIGAVLVLAVLAAATVVTYLDWSRTHPWMPKRQVAQAARAGRYLQHLGGDAPVVFVLHTGGRTPLSSTALAFHIIRSSLPPELIPRTLVYLGDAEPFLEGRPTFRPELPDFDEASRRHWPSVRAALRRDPVAVTMPAFNHNFRRSVAEHPEWLVAPDLAIVRGPATPGADLRVAPLPEPPTLASLLGVTAAALALLLVVGGGWSWWLVPAGWAERAALAPAFGIAVMVVTGLLADRAAVPFSRPGAASVAAVGAIAGWVLCALARRRGRRRGDEGSEHGRAIPARLPATAPG